MTDRYEAVAVRRYEDRDGNEKTAFTNIGVAWPMKERDGFTVRLNAMPAPDQGEFVILLMPPKPKEDNQSRDDRRDNRREDYRKQSAGREDRRSSYDDRDDDRSGRSANFTNDFSDDIPFLMEWRG